MTMSNMFIYFNSNDSELKNRRVEIHIHSFIYSFNNTMTKRIMDIEE